ncbi:unnamed protein product [Schistosoma curassoni]|uniref:ATPase_AAA_core domain-containing protein n=1 Tax=Schistosoma curassoni TaxID=6186 RepID=A0A183JYC5_9TREM|nr:unnamed protein product [Schistosoma curassoni]
MVIEGSQQETLDLGFVPLGPRQQRVAVIMRELMLPDVFDPVSPNFTIQELLLNMKKDKLGLIVDNKTNTNITMYISKFS